MGEKSLKIQFPPGRVSPTIYVKNQQSQKPAPTWAKSPSKFNSLRGGFHQQSMRETKNIINPPPPNKQSKYICFKASHKSG
ncbi:MAG: hypothetical protein EAZ96_24460 [Oscillatoriales cyanobacterium]|nr:MAG: hypothetical protein EAZ96_24460 [Oscillatoriales cyanobacterium]